MYKCINVQRYKCINVWMYIDRFMLFLYMFLYHLAHQSPLVTLVAAYWTWSPWSQDWTSQHGSNPLTGAPLAWRPATDGEMIRRIRRSNQIDAWLRRFLQIPIFLKSYFDEFCLCKTATVGKIVVRLISWWHFPLLLVSLLYVASSAFWVESMLIELKYLLVVRCLYLHHGLGPMLVPRKALQVAPVMVELNLQLQRQELVDMDPATTSDEHINLVL